MEQHNDVIKKGINKGLVAFDDDLKYITYIHQSKKYRYTDPEEKVRAESFITLVLDYGYLPTRIALEVIVPRRTPSDIADIVIFSDDEKKTPYIVVECKKEETTEPEFKQAIEQGFGNANSIKAHYLWVTSKSIDQYYNVKDYPPLEREENIIDDLPEYGKVKTEKPKYYKGGEDKHALQILTEKALTDLFKKAHQALWDGGKRTPSDAFDELNKIIFCKIYDEKTTDEEGDWGEPYKFQLFPSDLNEAQIKKKSKVEILFGRIQSIYEKGREEDPEVFRDDIRVTPAELTVIVGILAKVNLRDTDLDSKGRAFETFLKDDIFRGTYGQYFTPRSVIKFIIGVLPITNKSFVLDPSCGSGGFLLYALDKVRRLADTKFNKEKDPTKHKDFWHKFAENNLFGIEISEKIARTAKMNMIIHDDGHTNVISFDGLESVEKIGKHALKNKSKGHDKFAKNVFDFVITNPPFGSDVKSSTKSYIGDYDLGKKNFDWIEAKIKNVNLDTVRDSQKSEILFVEQYFEFLKSPTKNIAEGGIAAIVVPDGILTNSSSQFVRDWLQENYRIIAVVSIPQTAFTATGAGVKSSILFLKKLDDKTIQRNKEIRYNLENEIYNSQKDTLEGLIEERKYLLTKGDNTIQQINKELADYLDALRNQKSLTKELKTQLMQEAKEKIKVHEETEEYQEWRATIAEEYDTKIEAIKELMQEKFSKELQGKLTNYPIFMAIAEYIGYDATGKDIAQNDLEWIEPELEKFIKAINEEKDSFFL